MPGPRNRTTRLVLHYALQAAALLISLQVFYGLRAAAPGWVAFLVAFPLCLVLAIGARRLTRDPEDDD